MIRADTGPTAASLLSSGSTRTSSVTLSAPVSRATPSTSSGVYVEPPPTTAIFTSAHLNFHNQDTNFPKPRGLCQTPHEDDQETLRPAETRCGRRGFGGFCISLQDTLILKTK